MKNQDNESIWNEYVNENDTNYESMSDDELKKILKKLADEKMYYDMAPRNQWHNETKARHAVFAKMQKIRDILQSREREKNPPEPKPQFIPGAAKTRMMPREVNEVKARFREDGTFDKLLGDLNNPRNQTRTAVFYIKFGALPTEAEFSAEWLHDGDGVMAPFPFKPSQHPDLEGKIWHKV